MGRVNCKEEGSGGCFHLGNVVWLCSGKLRGTSGQGSQSTHILPSPLSADHLQSPSNIWWLPFNNWMQRHQTDCDKSWIEEVINDFKEDTNWHVNKRNNFVQDLGEMFSDEKAWRIKKNKKDILAKECSINEVQELNIICHKGHAIQKYIELSSHCS